MNMAQFFNNKETRARVIAALATLLAAVLIFLLLWYVGFTPSAPEPEVKANPALMAMEEDEFLDPEEFIEPPVEIVDAGEPDPAQDLDETPAPAPLGEPDQGPKSDKVVTSGDRTKPNNSAEKLVTQKQESSLKHTNPSKKDEPDSRITSEVGNKFNNHNGKQTGKQTGTSGSSDTGTGAGSAKGTLDGKRKMLSCDNVFNPPLKLSKTITVIVNVKVNDKGVVVWAKCRTSVNQDLARKLEKKSLGSRWTPKAGAPDAPGTITWTLKPSTK